MDVERLAVKARLANTKNVTAQRLAAQLRLRFELGRFLASAGPVDGNLNHTFHRYMAGTGGLAERLRRVYQRLGGYPEWSDWELADLERFRAAQSPAQLKVRLIGKELDAALADPRWQARERIQDAG